MSVGLLFVPRRPVANQTESNARNVNSVSARSQSSTSCPCSLPRARNRLYARRLTASAETRVTTSVLAVFGAGRGGVTGIFFTISILHGQGSYEADEVRT